MGNLLGIYQDGYVGYNLSINMEVEEGVGECPEDVVGGEDAELYADLCALVEAGRAALLQLQSYRGCSEVIRASMSSPRNMAVQREAFATLARNAEAIKGFYALAQRLQGLAPALLRRLAALPVTAGGTGIGERPSLVRKTADVLELVLDWDQAKMMHPQVQNDFAYYRRLLPKMVNEPAAAAAPVSDTDANVISMFIAENVPLTVTLAAATADTARRTDGVARVVATVANMCCGMVHRGIYSSEAINRKLLMAMTGAVVLYDRITDQGVFVKASGVGVSKCIKVLHKHGGQTGEQL
ncbi:unnamed protein product, partial [Phaeothamnion confervicola]